MPCSRLIKQLFIILFLLISSCTDFIKNKDAKVVVEDGTSFDTSNKNKTLQSKNISGVYTGFFEADLESDSVKSLKNISAGEAFYWTRENKISLFIDSITATNIKGHSIVAGNNTNFSGTITKKGSSYSVIASEQGNTKYKGKFEFILTDSVVSGTWQSFAKIDIENRKYVLKKTAFHYNANQMLMLEGIRFTTKKFVDWTKPKMNKIEKEKLKSKMTPVEKAEYEEFEEDTEFASATTNIYMVNASAILLTEKNVANLSKGDLLIIRNTIYARHGYSFKNRPLRVFFDNQPWYIPITTNIKNEFTEIEKNNIELLLRYEKIAKEYYDYFGRG